MKKKKGRGGKVSVTFEMPGNGLQAENFAVAGDFNKWSTSANPMKKQKDGTWATTVSLGPGIYRYRFVADGGKWYNDPLAEGHEPSGYGEENCVVNVEQL